MAGAQTLSVADAVGRIAAEPLRAPMSLPPFAASAMDGYALRSHEAAQSARFAVVGASYAGHAFSGHVPARGAVRIFTGAPVPDGLDAVVIQEDCARDGDTLAVHEPVAAGDNVRPIGHDVARGALLLDGGDRISEFHAGWLAACGITAVSVRPKPRVALFSTGDELLEPGSPLGPGRIYDANRHLLRALLARLPLEVADFGIVPDDPERILTTLQHAADRCDVLVTSGGVSVGDADRVREAVLRIGELRFWKLNLKPGKPLAYGRIGRALLFGLPGNPVSAVVTALMLVKPALEKLAGGTPRAAHAVPATLRGTVHHRPGREEFQRGTLIARGRELEVNVTGDQSSNRLASFASANCLIRIPKDEPDLVDGSVVLTLPFDGLL